ncbi:DNA excision repair protein ERCC-1 [Spathaspora sp. JA1]|nr:DNA excision repair protein ERCC-1 [Spathaspora sp. JA1]
MSEPQENDIDATSFASILAGVKRMREQYGGGSVEEGNVTEVVEQEAIPVPEPIPTPVATAAPPAPPAAAAAPTRTILLEPTAEPIPPYRQSTPTTSASSKHQTHRSATISEILVSKAQTGNPLLKESMMKLTPWKFDSTILSDYYISPTFQILFLSLKYYKIKPEYIWTRLKKLNKGTSIVANQRVNDRALRILLVVVDIDGHQEVIRKLSDICIKNDLTMVLAWSFEEAGNYIAMAKQLDNAPSKTISSIKGVRGVDYNSSVVEAFTSIKSINKTDVSNLLANYKSVKNIILESCKEDSENSVGEIGGLGTTKLRNLKHAFSEPFIYNKQYED